MSTTHSTPMNSEAILAFLDTEIGFSEVIEFLEAVPQTMEFDLTRLKHPVTYCNTVRDRLAQEVVRRGDLEIIHMPSFFYAVNIELAKALACLKQTAEADYAHKFRVTVGLPSKPGLHFWLTSFSVTAAGLLEYLRMVQGSDPRAIAKNFLDRL